MNRLAHLLLLCLPCAVWAGGSNYGITPGALPAITGKVSEWPVPTPKFARDPAVAPDGSVFIAVMHGNRIARFDPRTQKFLEWDLPDGANPHGLLVDPDGIVWYTGNGNGTIGRLDPVSGAITEHRVPSGGDPHTIVLDGRGNLWFTVQNGQRVGRLNRTTGKFAEYATAGNPYGLAIDARGIVWFCRFRGDKLGWIDPISGRIGELDMGRGSAPRRMATAPDGMLWVANYGSGTLAKVDPKLQRVLREYPLPAKGGTGAYAVTVDAANRIWVNGIDTDTVSLFDQDSETFRVLPLPSHNVGIRKAVIDARGRYWYMGSHNGRLGMIE